MHAVFGKMADRRVLAIILAVAAAMVAVSQLTGMLTDIVRLDMSIRPSAQGNIYIVGAHFVAIQYENSNITLALDNAGSVPLSGMIYVEIMNDSGSAVESFSSEPYLLEPGSYITYAVQWYAAQEPGNYTLVAWDNETNHTDSDNRTFSIHCEAGTHRCFGSQRKVCRTYYWEFVEDCLYGCSGGECLGMPSGRVGGEAAVAAPSYRMDVEHEEPIEVVQDTGYTTMIRVTNNGTSALTNITLQAWSEELEASVPEITVFSLQPGQSASFLIDIEVPALEPGNYSIFYTVRSDEVMEKDEITVTLVSEKGEYSPEQACSDSIERYFGILDSLEMDVRSAEMRGYDMEGVRGVLRDAMDELDVMRDLRERGLHEECSQRTGMLRGEVEDAVAAYSRAISRPVGIVFHPWIEHTIIIFITISLLIAIVMLVTWRRIRSWRDRQRLRLPERW